MVPDISDLAKTIQLALAPVFLLTGVAALLSVMTGRLARIIDRGRAMVEREVAVSPEHVSIQMESEYLEQRRYLTSVAITAATIAALLVCVVIGGLFVQVMLETPLTWLISALFAAAMFSLVVGLSFFLREVHLAMRTVRIAVPKKITRVATGLSTGKKLTESRRFADNSPFFSSYPDRKWRRPSMRDLVQ